MPATGLWFRTRLYPERGDRRYYHVLVFQSKHAMYDFWEAQHGLLRVEYRFGHAQNLAKDFEAMTSGWESFIVHRDGTETTRANVGQILFHRKRLGAGLVSHEMTHAALYWLDRLGYDPPMLAENYDVEERLCLVQGNLVGAFWRAFFRYEAREVAS